MSPGVGMMSWPAKHLQISFCLNDAGERGGSPPPQYSSRGRPQCLFHPGTKMQLYGQPVQWIWQRV